MNLASDQSSTVAKTAIPALVTNRAFLLKALTKTNLCVDDGGGKAPGVTKLSLEPCNPSSPNQVFLYDTATTLIKSSSKGNLCIEIGVGGNDMSLKFCDVRNSKQRITYDRKMQLFRSAAVKYDHQCFYDRGLDVVGTGLTTWTCDPGNQDQKFGFRYQDEALTEQQAVTDAVANGERFMLRVPGTNNSCLDDAGQAQSMFNAVQLRPCDADRKNQYFQWDASMKRFRSRNIQSRCLVVGGGSNLAACDAKSAKQGITYDRATLQLRVGGNCVEAGDRLSAVECNEYNAKQQFEYVLAPPLPSFNVPPELQLGKPVLLQHTGTTTCVSIIFFPGGAQGIVAGGCDPSKENRFRYNSTTYQLSNGNSNCLEIGSELFSQLGFGPCDTDNRFQVLLYDPETQLIRCPFNDMCVSVGAMDRSVMMRRLRVEKCNLEGRNQPFTLLGS